MMMVNKNCIWLDTNISKYRSKHNLNIGNKHNIKQAKTRYAKCPIAHHYC